MSDNFDTILMCSASSRIELESLFRVATNMLQSKGVISGIPPSKIQHMVRKGVELPSYQASIELKGVSKGAFQDAVGTLERMIINPAIAGAPEEESFDKKGIELFRSGKLLEKDEEQDWGIEVDRSLGDILTDISFKPPKKNLS